MARSQAADRSAAHELPAPRRARGAAARSARERGRAGAGRAPADPKRRHRRAAPRAGRDPRSRGHRRRRPSHHRARPRSRRDPDERMTAYGYPRAVRKGWDDVDRTAEPHAHIDYLGAVSALDSVQGVKNKSLRLMAVRPGDSVLDVGCGAGDEVIALARMGGDSGRAVGLDMSETMVSEGRRRAADAGVDAEFHTGDAQALPFEDRSFDAARIERT